LARKVRGITSHFSIMKRTINDYFISFKRGKNQQTRKVKIFLEKVLAWSLVGQMLMAPAVSEMALAANKSVTNPEVTAVIALLPIDEAPIHLLEVNKPRIDVRVGESNTEREVREQKEKEERARREAEEKAQATKAEAERFVLARSGRSNTGMSVNEALGLTAKYAEQYGVDYNLMSTIIACESGYNQYAKNKYSTASGYGQFIASTWRSTMRSMGRDVNTSPFEGEINIEATAYVLSVQGTRPWNASKGCWAR